MSNSAIRERSAIAGTPHRKRLLGVAVAIALALFADHAHALRPFVSTDADVVDVGEVEVELGYLTIERDEGETTYIVPEVVINYGLTHNWEAVVEFAVEKPPGSSWQLIDPAIFLKGVLREGALQDKPGLSIATEFGILLPSTSDGGGPIGIAAEFGASAPSANEGDESLGGEAILIASGRLASTTVHVNVGGGIDKVDARPFWIWGVIGEIAVGNGLTLVSEVAGEEVADADADRTALVGALFKPAGSATVFDMGFRRGLTSTSADWTATFGLTVSY